MRRLLAALVLAVAALAAGLLPAPARAGLLGQFQVSDGPTWSSDPPTYSCREACALLFGGAADDYRCSTSAAAIDGMATVDGWGIDSACEGPVADTYKLNTHYDCGDFFCSYSAYVDDHGCAATNYCWSPCGDGNLDPGEECDDGNQADGDCCDSTCHFESAGSACNGDVDVCDGTDTCDGAGACQLGLQPVCDDGDPCTQDSCDAVSGCANASVPREACSEPAGKASLSIDTAKQKESFAWAKGAVAIEQLGNPPAGTDTTLCVYDADALVQELLVEGDTVCDGKPCWKATGKQDAPTGFSYKDKAGAQHGLRAMTLKAGDGEKGKLSFDAKGGDLALDLGAGLATPVVVQVVNDNGGDCFEASFGADETALNDGTRFSAKHKSAKKAR